MQTHHDLPVSGVSAGEIASEGYDLDALLNQHFAGRVVRKDLTKQLKEGATSRCMCWSICSACTAPLTMTTWSSKGCKTLSVFWLITMCAG
mgnify:CR=1 FL=1